VRFTAITPDGTICTPGSRLATQSCRTASARNPIDFANIPLWTVNATLQIPNNTPFAESSSSAIPGIGSSPAFTFENGLRTAGALVTPSWILKNSPNLYFAHMGVSMPIGMPP